MVMVRSRDTLSRCDSITHLHLREEFQPSAQEQMWSPNHTGTSPHPQNNFNSELADLNPHSLDPFFSTHPTYPTFEGSLASTPSHTPHSPSPPFGSYS
jgi:hypothetical protein